MAMTASTISLAVEYVRSPLRAEADVLRRRPLRGVNLIPAATIRHLISLTGRPADGGAQHLVVLPASPPLQASVSSGAETQTRNIAPGHFHRKFPPRSTITTRPI